MAVLEDTSWYSPRYSLCIPLYFGRNRGPDFFQFDPSPDFPEFCQQEAAQGCYPGRNFTSVCVASELTNNGIKPKKQTMCQLTEEERKERQADAQMASKCFNVELRDAEEQGRCLKTKCAESGVVVYLENGEGVMCESGQTLDIETESDLAKIQCPDFEEFCGSGGPMKQRECEGRGWMTESSLCLCDACFNGKGCKKRVRVKTELCQNE